jgi:hypothetical protein
MQKIKENTYKVVSASAATLDTIGKPAVKLSHQIMIEGSNDLENSIEQFLENVEGNWYSPSKIVPYLKKANSAVQKLTRTSISKSYEDYMGVVCSFESFLTAEQKDLEDSLSRSGSRVHHEWVFSQENRKTTKELVGIVKKITKDLKNVSFGKIWKYLMTFIVLQKVGRAVGRVENVEPLGGGVLEVCRLMKYFSRYSVAVYGNYLVSLIVKKNLKDFILSHSEEQVFCEYLGLNEKFLIYSHIKSRKNIPGHCISIDMANQAVVVTLRGTQSLFDCMTDLKSDYDLFELILPGNNSLIQGQVHSGIMNSARQLDEEIKLIVLSCLNEWKNFSLVIVGHSLGAGVGTCLCLLWTGDKLFEHIPIKTFAFAPPPVVSQSLNEAIKDRVFSCVYGNDIVCRLSIGSIKDLAAGILELQNLERQKMLNPDEIYRNWFLDNPQSEEIFDVYSKVMEKMVNEKLVICGMILQIFKEGKHSGFHHVGNGVAGFGFGFCEWRSYQEIVLDRSCFLDHMPDTYEDALAHMVLDISRF